MPKILQQIEENNIVHVQLPGLNPFSDCPRPVLPNIKTLIHSFLKKN